MSEQNSAPGTPSGNSGQPQTDTQRLRAVEAKVHSLIPRVDALEARQQDTKRRLDLLRSLVESVLSAQGSIRDDLGELKAAVEVVGNLVGHVEDLGRKIDRLISKE